MAQGRVIYFGPCKDAVPYFTHSPYEFSFAAGSNPADFVIAVAGSFLLGSKGQKVSGSELADYYAQSDICRLFLENIDTMLAMDLVSAGQSSIIAETSKAKKDLFDRLFYSDEYPTSTVHQLKFLIERLVLTTLKDPKPFIAAIVRYILYKNQIMLQIIKSTSIQFLGV
jgi:hypothetical protein